MCGLFGFFNYGKSFSGNALSILCNSLSNESEIRGSHATGISFVKDKKLTILKQPKSASCINFKVPNGTVALMGHTRYTTQGSEKKNYNNHPFWGKIKNHEFSLAHNGVIANDYKLRTQLNLPKTNIETDSYICVQILESQNKLNFASIKDMAEKITGSFTLTILDDTNNLYIVKGDSPISILNFKQLGIIVYASTDSILWRAIIETVLLRNIKQCLENTQSNAIDVIELTDGEILKVSKTGKIEISRFDYKNKHYLFDYPLHSCCDVEYEISNLIDLGDLVGIGEEQIMSLIFEGFAPSEIEEILISFYN